MAGRAHSGIQGASLARILFVTSMVVITAGSVAWLFRWGGLQKLQESWKRQKDADSARAAIQHVKNHRFDGELSLATRLETVGRSLTQKGTPVSNPDWKATPVAGKPGTFVVSATLRGSGLEETFTWNVRPEKGEVLAADANAQRLDDIEHAVAGTPGPDLPGSPSARVARTNPFQPPSASPRAGRAGLPTASPRWPTLPPRQSLSPQPGSKPGVEPQRAPAAIPSAHLDLELIGVTKAQNRVVALVRYQGRLKELWQGSTLADGWKVKEIHPLGRSGTALVVVRGKEQQVIRLSLEAPPPGPGPAPAPPTPPREPPPPPPEPRPSGTGFPSVPPGPREPAPPGLPPDAEASPPPRGAPGNSPIPDSGPPYPSGNRPRVPGK